MLWPAQCLNGQKTCLVPIQSVDASPPHAALAGSDQGKADMQVPEQEDAKHLRQLLWCEAFQRLETCVGEELFLPTRYHA